MFVTSIEVYQEIDKFEQAGAELVRPPRAAALGARHDLLDAIEILPRDRVDEVRCCARVVPDQFGHVDRKFGRDGGEGIDGDVRLSSLDQRDVLRAVADALRELLLAPSAQEPQLLHPLGDAPSHVLSALHPSGNYWPGSAKDATAYRAS